MLELRAQSQCTAEKGRRGCPSSLTLAYRPWDERQASMYHWSGCLTLARSGSQPRGQYTERDWHVSPFAYEREVRRIK